MHTFTCSSLKHPDSVATELKAKASQTSHLQYITVSLFLRCSENSPAASETQHLRTKEATTLCSIKGAVHLLDLLRVPLEGHTVQLQRPFSVAPIKPMWLDAWHTHPHQMSQDPSFEFKKKFLFPSLPLEF